MFDQHLRCLAGRHGSASIGDFALGPRGIDEPVICKTFSEAKYMVSPGRSRCSLRVDAPHTRGRVGCRKGRCDLGLCRRVAIHVVASATA
jgi:hypothetical protein